MIHFNFTAISLNWKFLADHLSGLLKRSITSDLRMKKKRNFIVSIECNKIWLPNEVKFFSLPLITGENFWFTLNKSIVIQNINAPLKETQTFKAYWNESFKYCFIIAVSQTKNWKNFKFVKNKILFSFSALLSVYCDLCFLCLYQR